MNREIAEHISLLAAPIYAMLLAPWVATSQEVPVETLKSLRHHAVVQAHALWLDTLEHRVSPRT